MYFTIVTYKTYHSAIWSKSYSNPTIGSTLYSHINIERVIRINTGSKIEITSRTTKHKCVSNVSCLIERGRGKEREKRL